MMVTSTTEDGMKLLISGAWFIESDPTSYMIKRNYINKKEKAVTEIVGYYPTLGMAMRAAHDHILRYDEGEYDLSTILTRLEEIDNLLLLAKEVDRTQGK